MVPSRPSNPQEAIALHAKKREQANKVSKEVSRWRSEWQATDKQEMKDAMYQLPDGETFTLGKKVLGEFH